MSSTHSTIAPVKTTAPVVASAIVAPVGSTPIVASNASLAPVVASPVLHDAVSHLNHVPLTSDNATIFGGITMHPGTFASGEPIQQQQLQQQPIQQIQQPIQQIEQPIIRQVVQPIQPIQTIQQLPIVAIQQPIQPAIVRQIDQSTERHLPAGPVTPATQSPSVQTPSVHFHSLEETELLAQTPVGLQTPAADNSMLANRVQAVQLRTEKEQLHNVIQASPNELGSIHPAGAIVSDRPAASQLLQEKQQLTHVQLGAPNELGSIHPRGALVQPTDLNHPVASELLAEKQQLHHVALASPNALGSVHTTNAIINAAEPNHPPASALLAEKAALHHVALDRAPATLGGGQHLIAQPSSTVIPEQLSTLGAEVTTNAGLAGLIQPAELNKQHKALGHVSGAEVLPSSLGGQHPQGAQLGHAAIDRAALQHVKDNQLHHVAIEKAPTTLSGGVHLAGQPDATLIPEPTGALSGLVQPAQLVAAHKQLDSVPAAASVQPSQYGGLHSAGAQTGVLADRVALQYVKEHNLHHVALDKAPVTASGGQHTITQPDTTLIPEQAASSAPHHAALAGVVSAGDLKSEKRGLEHVPIERQHASATGALNMRDTAATEPLSIMDRLKSLVGLETKAEQRAHASAPGLGRVVERVPVAIEAHTITTPAQAAGASDKLASAPQNAQLAQKITPRDLRLEATQLLPVAGSAVLAPVINAPMLQAEHAQLHHVGGPVETTAPIATEKVLPAAPVAQVMQSPVVIAEPQPVDALLIASSSTVPVVSSGGQLAGVLEVESLSVVKPAEGVLLGVSKENIGAAPLFNEGPRDEFTIRAAGEQSYMPIR